MNIVPDPADQVLSVSALARLVNALLADALGLLRVEGEITGFKHHPSGHMYFALKDAQAMVSCALFRSRQTGLSFVPRDGMTVRLLARAVVYEARGQFQLVVERMEEAGEGALRRAFEALCQRLSAEGLFDTARKRPLPALPRQIGVVTSPAGAALRDILSVLERRFPAIPVLVYPVPVQGATAAPAIARMLALAGERAECDVLILARGGGSLEDLWAFNEEVVARALRDCPIPVVTGVGHETDTTIADLAADRRAATPSAAAEIVAPDRSGWRAQFTHRIRQLDRALSTRLLHTARAITTLSQRLERQHPERRLTARAQRLDELTTRLLRVASLNVQHARQRLATLSRTLDAVSPLATLGRGYAIVMRPDGRLVREAAGLAPGDRVQARLASGRIDCQVEAVHEA